ncbi:universal stress protein [Taklimakanibacter deserti]|uniref:universal stress protein n=1 Tax=Taklimakanibacter deserti TaxID=2267839 RepID=UPI000E65E659
MKSILVAVSGTSSDLSVLDAAYAVAAPLKAHIEFIHIPLAAIDVADFNHHIEFARGSGLDVALRDTLARSKDAEAKARAHATDFCASRNILRISQPMSSEQVTASWMANPVTPDADGFVRATRAHDLTVIGRSASKRSWSQMLLEDLAMDSGRPILIVPPGAAKLKLDRIAVWWKDHSAAARALTAALPVLGVARKVAIVSVLENGSQTKESTENVALQLGWHGIEATTEVHAPDHRPTVDVLWSATLARQADLVVMGGFSRPRIRELIFGGCTQSVLETGARSVFLLH